MTRPDIARITAAPAAHRLGVLAGAYGHDVLLAHHEAWDRDGSGTVHGNQCGVPAPAGAVSTDCTEYVLAVLDRAFRAAGLGQEWQAILRKAVRRSGSGGPRCATSAAALRRRAAPAGRICRRGSGRRDREAPRTPRVSRCRGNPPPRDVQQRVDPGMEREIFG
jgi:hypothetical protein